MNSHPLARVCQIALVLVLFGTAYISLRGPEAPSVAGQVAVPGCSDPVVVNAPAANLASIAASEPPGQCFLLEAGTYRFHDVVPKDGQAFYGASRSTVIVDGRGHENAFHGTADGVVIARMTFQDFDSSAGTSRQEQAPIRGTRALWASDRGQMATNWLVEDIVSQRNYAAGIFVGDHFTVRNSVFRDNGVTGVSGDSVVGGLIEGNSISGNGRQQAGGALVNGGGIKMGQSGTLADPVVIRNNEVFDNPNIGIWCDIGCQGFHVIDNYIHDHVSRGVMYELSMNVVVRGNTIVRSNTWTGFNGDFNAGAITIGESRNALVEDNYIEDAKAGVIVRQTRRPANGEGFLRNYPVVNYISGDVTVRSNTFVRTGAMGVSTGATGSGLIADPGSIRFTGNHYDDPTSMNFWENNGRQLTFAGWNAAGHDTTPSEASTPTIVTTAPPSVPATTPETPPSSESPPVASPTNGEFDVPRSVPQGEQPTGADQLPSFNDGVLRINAGGNTALTIDGVRWSADAYFVGGNTASHASEVDIASTDADELYRAERWGLAGYEIPVEAGAYRVVLHHAEVFSGCQAAGCREFSVVVEGERVASALDLYAEAGGFEPVVLETEVDVADGSLSIEFDASQQQPQVAGIEVFALSGSTPTNDNASQPTSTAGAAETTGAGTGSVPSTPGSQATTPTTTQSAGGSESASPADSSEGTSTTTETSGLQTTGGEASSDGQAASELEARTDGASVTAEQRENGRDASGQSVETPPDEVASVSTITQVERDRTNTIALTIVALLLGMAAWLVVRARTIQPS